MKLPDNWYFPVAIALLLAVCWYALAHDNSPAVKTYPCVDKSGYACDGGESASTY